MIDPGAMGTLLIGLERARHAFEPDTPRRRTSTSSTPRATLRLRAATVLYRLAARLEARPSVP